MIYREINQIMWYYTKRRIKLTEKLVPKFHLNNYIVRSYRDVIVVTNIAARRSYKA